MLFDEYHTCLPISKTLSKAKLDILKALWGEDCHTFPKPWVASAYLLELTGQKYFDRRVRELRDTLGCDIESSYRIEFSGHAWRLNSSQLKKPLNRDYLSPAQKNKLFKDHQYTCNICKTKSKAGLRGLQADHKIPVSRNGSSNIINWQPLCCNCNVSKKQACQGCLEDCKDCPWAFPENTDTKTIINISNTTLQRIDKYCQQNTGNRDSLIQEILEKYLDSQLV